VAIDSPVRERYRDLPWTARIARAPVIGQALKRAAPDAAIRDGLADAFAEGFEIPDQFVEDVRRMTFSSFKNVPEQVDAYIEQAPIDDRLAETGLPLLVVFGSEDTVVQPPAEAADEFRDVPGARVVMLDGIGHTPQVEAPRRTAALIRGFDRSTR
jgi:pimeloyl-ACP methyl ester carboxylesterase